jgi:ferredoxin-like protein FixX
MTGDSQPQEWIISQRLDELNKYFNNHHDDLIRIAWKNVRDDIHPHFCISTISATKVMPSEDPASDNVVRSAEKLIECKTCILVGTRACMHHGYPDDNIPKSCQYKIGTDAEEALENLNLLKRAQR